jgi:uncharacterized protein
MTLTLSEPSVLPLDEELAGPVVPNNPVNLRERISSIDVLRGAALLGILVLNIEDFAGPEFMHDLPIPYQFFQSHVQLNTVILFIKFMFFEGKMRGIFSMLFGAGVVLLTSRAEKRGAGKDVADIYTRRNMLLMLFGVLHGVFLWHGDILLDYGIDSLLFLYPLRRLSAKTLLWIGTLMSLIIAPLGAYVLLDMGQDFRLSPQVAQIQASKTAPLSKEQTAVLQQWQNRIDENAVTPEKVQAQIQDANSGYIPNLINRVAFMYQIGFATVHLDLLADYLSAMILGMGLMKIGFFTAELSYATYWWTVIAGFAISLPVYGVGIWKVITSGFFFFEAEKWLYLPYYIGREAGSIAIAALILLVIKSGSLKRIQHLLAAVGRTALSNYLLTTVLCQTLFIYGPWKLYGKLAYYQQLYVVAGVWLVNLVGSTIWLRYFSFGPVEWLWRSLTYGKRQAFRLTAE